MLGRLQWVATAVVPLAFGLATIALQRDLGWQLRLFPADAPRDDVEVEVDLCVSDDLAGMYYIG